MPKEEIDLGSDVFQPIYGAYSEGPLCYLLELDGVCIMLDCGWDERFNTEDLEALKAVAPRVEYVLISHSDLAHIGALAYAGRCTPPCLTGRPVRL
jgi:cleavage and polyadenylation specificity factor subunit 2